MRTTDELINDIFAYLDDIRDNFQIERIPVESSNIAAIGYDPFKHILEVEFLGDKGTNSVYRYFDVPDNIFVGVMEAQSHGKYFWQYIRNTYKFQQVS